MMSEAFIWITVFLSIGLPALLATKWLVIWLERRRRSAFVNDMMDALQTDQPKPEFRQRLIAAGRLGLLLPIWPLAAAALLTDVVMDRKPSFDDLPHPDEAFNATGFLTQRLTVPQAEVLENIPDPRGERPARPFGHLAEAWNLFLIREQSRCELWAFERPEGKTNGFNDRYSRGYCWVKAGKVIAEIAIEGEPGVRLITTPRLTEELRG